MRQFLNIQKCGIHLAGNEKNLSGKAPPETRSPGDKLDGYIIACFFLFAIFHSLFSILISSSSLHHFAIVLKFEYLTHKSIHFVHCCRCSKSPEESVLQFNSIQAWTNTPRTLCILKTLAHNHNSSKIKQYFGLKSSRKLWDFKINTRGLHFAQGFYVTYSCRSFLLRSLWAILITFKLTEWLIKKNKR